MIQLSGLDGLFVNMEMRGLPMHISSFSVYNPGKKGTAPPAMAVIKQAFQEAVVERIPQLRCMLKTVPMSMDQPYWVQDPAFNIDLHVKRMALPQPGNWQTLCEILADLQAETLSRDKPLWEAHVIENLDGINAYPEGSFGVLLKVHHALMDGRTGLKIFTNLHSLSPTEAPMAVSHADAMSADDEPAEEPGFQHPSMLDMLQRSSINNTHKTLRLMGLVGRRLPKALQNLREARDQGEISTIEVKERTCFNDVISQRRVLDRIRVPIATIKAIRKAVPGCTLNDVAMTIISGGLRRYLYRVESLPESSLVATIPIDVRGRKDRHKMGNRLSIMNVSLASDIEDELERLRQVHTESSNAKRFSRTMGKQLLSDILDSVYPGLMAWGMPPFINSDWFGKLPVVANTVITNVPGANMPLYFAGSELLESFGMGPLIPNTSLFHTVTSTCDWLSISFVSCPEAMKHPALYTHALVDSFQQLAEQAGVGTVIELNDNASDQQAPDTTNQAQSLSA